MVLLLLVFFVVAEEGEFLHFGIYVFEKSDFSQVKCSHNQPMYRSDFFFFFYVFSLISTAFSQNLILQMFCFWHFKFFLMHSILSVLFYNQNALWIFWFIK